MLKKGEFGAGSMGPKVQAAVNFVEAGGSRAVIADLDDATSALDGDARYRGRRGLTPCGSSRTTSAGSATVDGGSPAS